MTKNNNKSAAVTEEIVLETAPAPTALTTYGSNDDEFAGDADVLTKDDIVISRFKVCQAMTLGKRDAGLKDGQIYDTLTKKGYDSMLIVPVLEDRVVVERAGEGKEVKKGSFVREHAVDSEVVKSALARNGQKFGKELATLEGNALEETRNIHFAMLEADGVTVNGFGILVATSTNLFPVKQWKNQRVGFTRVGGKGALSLPTYAFRTVVDGQGIHPKNETSLYRFAPFKNNNWKDSAIDPDNCSAQELALLRNLKKHAELIKGGQVKVAEYNDADDSEEAAEQAAF